MRRRRRTADVPEEMRAYLFDEPMPEGGNPFTWLNLKHDRAPSGPLAEAWAEHGATVLTVWVAQNPGTRPSTWWRFDAPEPRRRLGGTGTPGVAAPMERGIPTSWPALDPDDPPRFEAEAVYLRRLDLLEPGEADRIPPSGFRPEAVRATESSAGVS